MAHEHVARSEHDIRGKIKSNRSTDKCTENKQQVENQVLFRVLDDIADGKDPCWQRHVNEKKGRHKVEEMLGIATVAFKELDHHHIPYKVVLQWHKHGVSIQDMNAGSIQQFMSEDPLKDSVGRSSFDVSKTESNQRHQHQTNDGRKDLVQDDLIPIWSVLGCA